MSEDLIVQTNGPYLRIVLPDFEPDWVAVWGAVDFELEEGIERVEVVAPCYADDDGLAGVRDLVEQLERRGDDASSGRARRPARRPEQSSLHLSEVRTMWRFPSAGCGSHDHPRPRSARERAAGEGR